MMTKCEVSIDADCLKVATHRVNDDESIVECCLPCADHASGDTHIEPICEGECECDNKGKMSCQQCCGELYGHEWVDDGDTHICDACDIVITQDDIDAMYDCDADYDAMKCDMDGVA